MGNLVLVITSYSIHYTKLYDVDKHYLHVEASGDLTLSAARKYLEDVAHVGELELSVLGELGVLGPLEGLADVDDQRVRGGRPLFELGVSELAPVA